VWFRAARAGLDWKQIDLARKSGVSLATVQKTEGAADVPPITAGNLYAIERALEDAGITFIDDGEQSLTGGPGLRLRRRQ
jgi:transcriptional regulator with XRE-family HTH domain